MNSKNSAIIGCILGTAVGDALGLPYEGLPRSRAVPFLGPPDRYRFFFGRGMISDDTEHTCMVAQSLIESGGNIDVFVKRFARRLRWWLLALPAGVGKATAISCVKLWLGYHYEKSGVNSAGNGPAMRAAIFGAAIDNEDMMIRFVRASSSLTHRDPKAELGALAVALAARESRHNATIDAKRWLDALQRVLGNEHDELIDLAQRAISSVEAGESTQDYCFSIGQSRGVSGYTYDTVPVCIHAWLSHPRDMQRALASIIECGGDADTTAAIVGGIVGSGVGQQGIPAELTQGIFEWPRSVRWMERLGRDLADATTKETAMKSPRVNPIAVLLRNVLFLSVVLFHGFRRLAPPY